MLNNKSYDDNLKLLDEYLVKYPELKTYTEAIIRPTRDVIGRDFEIQQIQVSFSRAELCNVLLIAEAGTGKTTLVQGAMMKDLDRIYLELHVSKIMNGVGDKKKIPETLRVIFKQVEEFKKDVGKQIVLFMDEFHQIVKTSPDSVEVLKPLLANSGRRGLNIIAATTFDEYQEFLAPNQPLIERLTRINLKQPDTATTVSILRNFAITEGVSSLIHDDQIFKNIVSMTNRYLTRSSQPRKSVLVFDAMYGWHKATGELFTQELLSKVMYHNEGIQVDFQVDVNKIEKDLTSTVLAQDLAATAIANRLQMSIAGLENETKPRGSFLFTGTTGVGKTEMAKQLAISLFNDPLNLIRFDMAEYSNANRLESFREALAAAIWARPFSLVLFDEIEKADSSMLKLLLGVLDDGRLTDRHGKQVTFLNCYIILTTNVGADTLNALGSGQTRIQAGRSIEEQMITEDIPRFDITTGKLSDDYEQYEESMKRKLDDIERVARSGKSSDTTRELDRVLPTIKDALMGGDMPPEVLGRIDVIAPFIALPRRVKRQILYRQIKSIIKRVKMLHDIELIVDPLIIPFIETEKVAKDASGGGARDVKGALDSFFTGVVARYININPTHKKIVAMIDNENDLVFHKKDTNTSIASVKVAAYDSMYDRVSRCQRIFIENN